VARLEAGSGDEVAWCHVRRPWGRGDALSLLAWTVAIAAFFRDVVGLRRALFYFDITEINYPYRAFLARELKAGRFSRWCPDLYCGMPLYSESQAGYLHPLKYLLYPWLPTWQALNLDTVLSVWLAGLAAYGWLRRHVGPAGALTGAAVFGLGGFTWAHLVHTSMANALTSVPFVFWALEVAWSGARRRGVALGALALAFQVFAGHLQDTILTVGAVGLYALYRAATERGAKDRFAAVGIAAGMVVLGMVLAAVQWVPSKELLDRSPRASGLSWAELTFGSWSPELLPTLLVREAYGTRARDTDWMDGFYPYLEMDTYLGAIALGLAVVGGAAYRDRWVGFWVLLAALGGVLMLGQFTFLFDLAHRIPVLGSARIPVRFHLWVSLAVAALAAVGVDRLARPGEVRLRGAAATVLALAALSAPILLYVYAPVWTEPARWSRPYHLARYAWLGRELAWAAARTSGLALLAGGVAAAAARANDPRARARAAALLPALVAADLLGAHWSDVPTVPPGYWTEPPPAAQRLRADASFVRVYGQAVRSSAEPGYASEPVDFPAARDTLAWSLPTVWGLASSGGETPMISRRTRTYAKVMDRARPDPGRFDLEGVTHLVIGRTASGGGGQGEPAGTALILRNPRALPRARLMGRPVYVPDEGAAAHALGRLGDAVHDRLVVEDPDRPLPADADVAGTAAIVREGPERVEVTTDSTGPSYLVLADTFDPGWSATLDGRPAPIRPAYLTFRAVYVPRGRHTLVFTYRPAGFLAGLIASGCGVLTATVLLARPRPLASLAPEHGKTCWRPGWPRLVAIALVVVVLTSGVEWGPGGFPQIHRRWTNGFHRFTWGAGIEAMRPEAGGR